MRNVHEIVQNMYNFRDNIIQRKGVAKKLLTQF